MVGDAEVRASLGLREVAEIRREDEETFSFRVRDGSLAPLQGGGPSRIPEDLELTIDFVRNYLPGLDPRPSSITSCVSTALDEPEAGKPFEQDRLQIVDDDRFAIFAGGHLFKHAPNVGRHLAAVALGGEVPEILRPR